MSQQRSTGHDRRSAIDQRSYNWQQFKSYYL